MVTDDKLCVAVLANSSWNIFNFRKTLIQFLADQNYRVIVIAPEDEYTKFIISWKYIEYIPIKHLNAKSRNPFQDFLLVFEYFKLLKLYKPAMILPHTIKPNIYSSLAARWLNISTVSSLTGLGTVFIRDTFVNRIIQKFYHWALSGNKYLLFHNHLDRNEWCQRSLFPISKTFIIPGSGVDLNRFKPDPVNINSRQFIFLYLGRLHPDKGIREFLLAAKILSQEQANLRFWVAGDLLEADYKNGYEEIVHLLHSIPKLDYLGKKSEVATLLKQVHFVVLPTYREGMSRSLMEAMAMCKPVIASNVAGVNELITDGVEGFLVPAKDIQSLSNAMVRMSQLTDEQYKSMGAAGRLKIESFYSNQKVCEAYSELFLKVIH